MYKEISVEQRTHDLAVQAVIHNYQLRGESVTEENAFEFAIEYRRLLKGIRDSVSEGQSDLE